MTAQWRECTLSGLFEEIRFRVVKHLYHAIFIAIMHDTSWQKPFVSSLSLKASSRVLDFGPGSSLMAVTLGLRYPEASFIGADPDPKAVKRAQRRIVRRQIGNVVVICASLDMRLPFGANSFDKIVCTLTLHDCLPDEKNLIVHEFRRVLRHGGTLYVADYDRPETPRESAVLTLARYVSGAAAVESHISGSWTGFLTRAGFSAVRRQSSVSIGAGRILLVKAQKR